MWTYVNTDPKLLGQAEAHSSPGRALVAESWPLSPAELQGWVCSVFLILMGEWRRERPSLTR